MRVTASVAMLPAAPGRTSTRNCWPSFSDRNWATTRATMSDALPAAWPTMIFTGRDGYACALAEAGSTAAPAARRRNCLRGSFMMHLASASNEPHSCRMRANGSTPAGIGAVAPGRARPGEQLRGAAADAIGDKADPFAHRGVGALEAIGHA